MRTEKAPVLCVLRFNDGSAYEKVVKETKTCSINSTNGKSEVVKHTTYDRHGTYDTIVVLFVLQDRNNVPHEKQRINKPVDEVYPGISLFILFLPFEVASSTSVFISGFCLYSVASKSNPVVLAQDHADSFSVPARGVQRKRRAAKDPTIEEMIYTGPQRPLSNRCCVDQS